jgi:hypothetical protein
MALDFTTDALVDRVRRTLQLLEDNGKLTEAEILQVCDEEIQQNLFPSLLVVREDYQVASSTVLLSSGIAQYRLPIAAASSTLDHVNVVRLDGTTPDAQWELDRIETPELTRFTGATQGVPRVYAVVGDVIHVAPTPDSTTASGYVLNVYHERRPSQLCAVSECALILSVADATPSVEATIDGSIATTAITTNTVVDIVPAGPPLGPYVISAIVTDITNDPVITMFPGYSMSATQLVFQMGQGGMGYIVPTGTTCVFPLPDAWWSAAILACSASVARIIGDGEQAATLRDEANAAIARLVAFQSSRVRKQPHVMMDRGSPNRRNRGGGPWRGGIS